MKKRLTDKQISKILKNEEPCIDINYENVMRILLEHLNQESELVELGDEILSRINKRSGSLEVYIIPEDSKEVLKAMPTKFQFFTKLEDEDEK